MKILWVFTPEGSKKDFAGPGLESFFESLGLRTPPLEEDREV